MNKEDVVCVCVSVSVCAYMYVYIYRHTYNGRLPSHKKEWNFAICNNIGGLGGYDAKWKKSDRKTNTVYHLYVESQKYNKPVNITKKKQTHRYRKQTSNYQWGEERGEGYQWEEGRGEGVKRYKLLCIKLATRIYCTTLGIQLIFYNNYKWSITFKNCELYICNI